MASDAVVDYEVPDEHDAVQVTFSQLSHQSHEPEAVRSPGEEPEVAAWSPETQAAEPASRAENPEVAKVVDFVVGMELRFPDLLRAVPAWAALRHLFKGRSEATETALAKMYSLSHKVSSINEFWSHSWHGRRSMKIFLLLMLKNGFAAVVLGLLAALLAAFLLYKDVLPGWDRTPRIHPEGYSGEIRSSPLVILSGLVVSSLTLFLWRSGDPVFLDQICIHQGDPVLKASALVQMGAVLKNSKKLVVLWDPTYLSRAWCVYELAAFLHSHRDDKPVQVLVKPTVFAYAVFVIVIGGVLLLVMETSLPYSALLLLVRVLYTLAHSVLLALAFEDFWRSIFLAEEQFRTFSWPGALCHCCSADHLMEDGKPIPCDKVILKHCLEEWFGSVDSFEECVRTTVRENFLGRVTRGYPLGFLWLAGANSFIVWGQSGALASWARAGEQVYAMGILINTVAWWFWLAPTMYLIFSRIARWMQKKRSEKLSPPAVCAVVCAGYSAYVLNAGLPHLYFWFCNVFLAEPIYANLAFAGTTLCWAVAVYHILAKPK